MNHFNTNNFMDNNNYINIVTSNFTPFVYTPQYIYSQNQNFILTQPLTQFSQFTQPNFINLTQNSVQPISITREEKELEMKTNIIAKCEKFLTQVLDKLILNDKLEILILDIEQNSRFYPDDGTYLLKFSKEADYLQTGEKIIYLIYNLYDDSEKLAKIIKICTIIYTKSVKNTLTTKRELYYNDVELFKNTQCIDAIIHDICSIFNLSRFDLCVFPAQKGLFAGDLTIYDSEGNLINNNKNFDKINLISFEYFLEEIYIETNAQFILVVEKESLFFNLVGSKLYKETFANSILITGKGFPDYLTKFFLKKISELINFKNGFNIPVFYFGDFDPSGIEIFLNYHFGCKTSSRENTLMTLNNMIWIGLSYDNIFRIIQNEGEESVTLIKLEEKELKKIENIMNKEYFNLDLWEDSNNPCKENILRNLNTLSTQFEKMKEFQFKAEGEVIVSKYIEHFVEYLSFIIN